MVGGSVGGREDKGRGRKVVRLGGRGWEDHWLRCTFDLCVPRKGIARPHSQFPYPCVCE